MSDQKLEGRRAVRVDKDGRRMPGVYAVVKVERDWRGVSGGFLHLRRTDGKPTKRTEGFSRSRVRVETVDADFLEKLAENPDAVRMTDADLLRECLSILRTTFDKRTIMPSGTTAERYDCVAGRVAGAGGAGAGGRQGQVVAMSAAQVWWWEDAADGSYSEIRTCDGDEPVVHAAAWLPTSRRRSWETSIAVRGEGLEPSLASSKVEAEAALRRDAERIVTALGGKVVWS